MLGCFVTDLKTAQRLEREGHTYTVEMHDGRPTGRCVVRLADGPR